MSQMENPWYFFLGDESHIYWLLTPIASFLLYTTKVKTTCSYPSLFVSGKKPNYGRIGRLEFSFFPGWTGSDCDESIDDCIDNRCVNGQCVDSHLNYTCLCARGYEGRAVTVHLSILILHRKLWLPENNQKTDSWSWLSFGHGWTTWNFEGTADATYVY